MVEAVVEVLLGLTFCPIIIILTRPHSNIMPPLINVLQNADFKTKKEACWAISNATSGGLQEPNQIRYMVQQGVIKPLCDLLKSMDNKIIQVGGLFSFCLA
jgi:hypothetical protein